MRPLAQVGEGALPIYGHLLIGELVDELQLIGLMGKYPPCLLLFHLLPGEGQVGGDDLPHPGLDYGEVFRG